MRALRWHGAGQLRLETIATPAPGEHDAILRVAYCGICGTDLEEYTSGPLLIPVRPHPLTGRMAPLTLGHEFTGTVTAIGSGVSALEVGQRVAPEVALACRRCVYCRAGQPALCESWAALGLQADGGLAEFVRLPAEACRVLPDAISDLEAAFVEPLEVAVRAVLKAGLTEGGTLVITGAGPIGLLVLQVARALGAGRVLVAEPQRARAELARRLGADEVVDVIGAPAADAAVECAGRPESIAAALGAVRKGGRVVQVGIPTGPVRLDLMPLIAGERQLVGSVQHQLDDLETALGLLAEHKVEVLPLISEVVPLSDAPAAFARLAGDARDAVKVLIDTNR